MKILGLATDMQERGITILAKNAAVTYKGIKAGCSTKLVAVVDSILQPSGAVALSADPDQHRGHPGPRRLWWRG